MSILMMLMCLKIVVRWRGVVLFLFVRLMEMWGFFKSNWIIIWFLIFVVVDRVVCLFKFCVFILVWFCNKSWIIFLLLEWNKCCNDVILWKFWFLIWVFDFKSSLVLSICGFLIVWCNGVYCLKFGIFIFILNWRRSLINLWINEVLKLSLVILL